MSNCALVGHQIYTRIRWKIPHNSTAEIKTAYRPGQHLEPIVPLEFVLDRKLFFVTYLREYLKRTKVLRGNNSQLLLSYIKPFKPVTKATVARWVKIILQQAGIDVSTYTTHSSRAAATSHAQNKD